MQSDVRCWEAWQGSTETICLPCLWSDLHCFWSCSLFFICPFAHLWRLIFPPVLCPHPLSLRPMFSGEEGKLYCSWPHAGFWKLDGVLFFFFPSISLCYCMKKVKTVLFLKLFLNPYINYSVISGYFQTSCTILLSCPKELYLRALIHSLLYPKTIRIPGNSLGHNKGFCNMEWLNSKTYVHETIIIFLIRAMTQWFKVHGWMGYLTVFSSSDLPWSKKRKGNGSYKMKQQSHINANNISISFKKKTLMLNNIMRQFIFLLWYFHNKIFPLLTLNQIKLLCCSGH